jgi:hypothetical protein
MNNLIYFIFIIVLCLVILYIFNNNYDNFNKTYNINLNSDNTKIYIPLYSPWRMYYPLQYLYNQFIYF